MSDQTAGRNVDGSRRGSCASSTPPSSAEHERARVMTSRDRAIPTMKGDPLTAFCPVPGLTFGGRAGSAFSAGVGR
jgi:hypothetical protein